MVLTLYKSDPCVCNMGADASIVNSICGSLGTDLLALSNFRNCCPVRFQNLFALSRFIAET